MDEASASQRRVDASISVNTNVTVPEGSADTLEPYDGPVAASSALRQMASHPGAVGGLRRQRHGLAGFQQRLEVRKDGGPPVAGALEHLAVGNKVVVDDRELDGFADRLEIERDL